MLVRRVGVASHAEVTHVSEEAVPAEAQHLFSFFGKEHVPAGTYALTIGTGQPPIAKLRRKLQGALRTGSPIDVCVEQWRIQQLPETVSHAERDRTAGFSILLDRMSGAIKKKRRQARDSGVDRVLIGLVLLDRDSGALVEYLAAHPEVLSPMLWGSGAGAPMNCGLLIGAVRFDKFPPQPTWTLALPDEMRDTAQVCRGLPSITVPQYGGRIRTLEGEHQTSSRDERVFYATRTFVPAPGGAAD